MGGPPALLPSVGTASTLSAAVARPERPLGVAAPCIPPPPDRPLVLVRPIPRVAALLPPPTVRVAATISTPLAVRPGRTLAPRSDLWVCNGGLFEVVHVGDGQHMAQCTVCPWRKLWKAKDGTSSLRAHSKAHKSHLAHHATNWAAPPLADQGPTLDAILQALKTIEDAMNAPGLDLEAARAVLAAVRK